MSFLKTALYVKNISNVERVVRLLVGNLVAVVGIFTLESPWKWIVVLAGVGFAISGIVGFCPACALVGRRLEKRQ
jgi:hypothetical protein